MRSYGNGAPDGQGDPGRGLRVKLSEVDEMILSRFEAAGNEDIGREENEPWPQEFCHKKELHINSILKIQH